MNVVISQPRYLPALNFLQRLAFADLFIVFDTVQRESRGFENRNRLLLAEPKWLTVPVSSPSRAIICDVKIAGARWIGEHARVIAAFYAKHPFYSERLLEELYSGLEENLTQNDYAFAPAMAHLLRNACRLVDVSPSLRMASDIHDPRAAQAQGPAKLLAICESIGADSYTSGPNGRTYGVSEVFAQSSVGLQYHDFVHPTYPQPNRTQFVPYMGFVDALFCAGVDWIKGLVTSPPSLATERKTAKCA